MSKQQPTRYLSFPDEFKQLILSKEDQGLVYWLKPECDYKKVSNFFCSLKDPSTGEPYSPLNLQKLYWENFPQEKLKFCHRGIRVYYNLAQGEHDYDSVCELIYQSNPTLKPILRVC